MITPRPRDAVHRAFSIGSRRRGFTLLELLIATALSSVLLVVVWHTLWVHSRLYERRQRSTEQTQLARALIQQFLSDLDHLVRPAGAGVRAPSIRIQSPADLTVLPSPRVIWGLRGDRHSLELAVLETGWEPPTNQTLSGPAELPLEIEVPTESPLRTIHYRFVGARDNAATVAGSLSAVVDEALTQQSEIPLGMLTQDPPAAGLIRESRSATASRHIPTVVELPAEALDAPPDALPGAGLEATASHDSGTPNRPSLTSTSADHIPEINWLAFRYFDGQQWLPSWDSELSGDLPVAIELTFDLAPSAKSRQQTTEEFNRQPSVPGVAKQSAKHWTKGRSAAVANSLGGMPQEDPHPAYRSLAVLRPPSRWAHASDREVRR